MSKLNTRPPVALAPSTSGPAAHQPVFVAWPIEDCDGLIRRECACQNIAATILQQPSISRRESRRCQEAWRITVYSESRAGDPVEVK